jgi:hypothetical protein
MPTFADHFVAELARSGVPGRLKPWGELFVQFQKMLEGTVQMASAIAERAEENFPSKAYRPYLEGPRVHSICGEGTRQPDHQPWDTTGQRGQECGGRR